jgi:DNA-binding protein YbaB
MLEDLIMAAINEAMDKVSKASQDEMSKLTGGINIPGLF